MRSAHLNKIADRVTRLIPITSDTPAMRKVFTNAMGKVRWQTVLNRVSDLQQLVLKDVPDLVTTVKQLKIERTELRRQLLDLRVQLEVSIVAEDGVEVESKPYEFWEGHETPASRED